MVSPTPKTDLGLASTKRPRPPIGPSARTRGLHGGTPLAVPRATTRNPRALPLSGWETHGAESVTPPQIRQSSPHVAGPGLHQPKLSPAGGIVLDRRLLQKLQRRLFLCGRERKTKSRLPPRFCLFTTQIRKRTQKCVKYAFARQHSTHLTSNKGCRRGCRPGKSGRSVEHTHLHHRQRLKAVIFNQELATVAKRDRLHRLCWFPRPVPCLHRGTRRVIRQLLVGFSGNVRAPGMPCAGDLRSMSESVQIGHRKLRKDQLCQLMSCERTPRK